MATCKETTDEVDGLCSCNRPMSVTMSDEYTLDDGNESDGIVTDSSTDSETTLGRGIDIIVHYKNKLRKKLQEFKKPLYIPLTLEKYLKWQYITNNRSLLQQKMAELANITENVTISDGILEVFLRIQKEAYDFDSLEKIIEETLLSDTDSIAVSWFPLKASHPSTEFLQVLNKIVQHSDIADELYTKMTDTLNSKVIRCVHDVKYLDKAKEIINQAVQEFEKKMLSKGHSININLPIVYSHVFEKYDMKRRVRTVSPDVLVFFNVMESKDEFNVELRGQQKDLNRVRKWIEEVFINPYCCLELEFGEVQTCEESIDIPSIIMNTLEKKNFQDLFWTINNHSKKTWICSSKSDDAHEAVQVVKTCVKQTKERKKTTKPVEEIESMVEELVAVYRDILGRSVSVRVLTEDDKDLAIYLTGAEHQLDSINNWFNSYTRSTAAMETYAATKQDSDLTPGSDQNRTLSDLTISSRLIPSPSQASNPIFPATEKAIVEDRMNGLPPKLPHKYADGYAKMILKSSAADSDHYLSIIGTSHGYTKEVEKDGSSQKSENRLADADKKDSLANIKTDTVRKERKASINGEVTSDKSQPKSLESVGKKLEHETIPEKPNVPQRNDTKETVNEPKEKRGYSFRSEIKFQPNVPMFASRFPSYGNPYSAPYESSDGNMLNNSLFAGQFQRYGNPNAPYSGPNGNMQPFMQYPMIPQFEHMMMSRINPTAHSEYQDNARPQMTPWTQGMQMPQLHQGSLNFYQPLAYGMMPFPQPNQPNQEQNMQPSIFSEIRKKKYDEDAVDPYDDTYITPLGDKDSSIQESNTCVSGQSTKSNKRRSQRQAFRTEEEKHDDDYVVEDQLSLHKERDRWELKYGSKEIQLPEEIGTCASPELNTKECYIATEDDVYPFSIKGGFVVFEKLECVVKDK